MTIENSDLHEMTIHVGSHYTETIPIQQIRSQIEIQPFTSNQNLNIIEIPGVEIRIPIPGGDQAPIHKMRVKKFTIKLTDFQAPLYSEAFYTELKYKLSREKQLIRLYQLLFKQPMNKRTPTKDLYNILGFIPEMKLTKTEVPGLGDSYETRITIKIENVYMKFASLEAKEKFDQTFLWDSASCTLQGLENNSKKLSGRGWGGKFEE